MNIFFIGGFRQSSLGSVGLFDGSGKHILEFESAFINLNKANNDSLKSRWERVKLWLINPKFTEQDSVIIGYSMGCHLAVKFASELLSRRPPPNRSVYLLAPDPKYRETQLDENSPESAYREAQELWETNEAPGNRFERELTDVQKHYPVYIAACNMDEVAEWTENVEFLLKNFAATMVTNRETAHIGKMLEVDLSPVHACSETWIHEQMYERCRFRQLE